MARVFEARGLTRRFDTTVALEGVDLTLDRPSIVALVGKNGSGKTTLLRHIVGWMLPTEGTVTTLGSPSDRLGHAELSRIGYVPQEVRLLEWMRVEQQIRYVASFYPRWDVEREQRLCEELELDPEALVGTLSTGGVQKLAIVLAVGHHPELLLLDEPVSALDPIVRARMLAFLLEMVREDGSAIVVSSHVLRDVERIVDHVVCLERGRVSADAGLDDLKERYVTWNVTARNGTLPAKFTEPWVLEQEVSGREARLLVDARLADREAFLADHHVELDSRPMNLEQIFPLLVAGADR